MHYIDKYLIKHEFIQQNTVERPFCYPGSCSLCLIDFDQTNHKIDRGCSVNYKNKIWFFGGAHDKLKVSTLDGCRLKIENVALPEL